MSDVPFRIGSNTGFKGYTADASFAPSDRITEPSINCLINENGEVEQRLGFEAVEIDLGVPGKPARSFYMEQWDITVFTLGDKVKYWDHSTNAVVDTGLTLTDGTITRGDAYAGDLYLTNTTDGLRRLVFFRLRGTATSGATTLNVDYDGAARLSVFSITSGTIRINGIPETFSTPDIALGQLPVTALTQDHADNSICVVVSDISSGREKASKVFFWKERMGLMGSEVAGNADQPNATEYFGKFAGPQTLEDIVDFTYGSGGSTRELVGRFGKLTNVVPTEGFLYSFKDNQSYVASAAEVVISGDGIGTTTPNLRDENNGCLNEDCAATTGFSEVTYVTPSNRVIRFRTSTPEGATDPYADEAFDVPLRKHLVNMDRDQRGAFTYYYRGQRLTIYQLKIAGQWMWFIFDHKIRDWQPPQQIAPMSSLFERQGVLYGTDFEDDTVYSIFTTFEDNGVAIYSEIWLGNFNVRDAEVKYVHASGLISQPAAINLQSHVTNMRSGRRSGSPKQVLGSRFSYSDDRSVGAVPVGGPGGPSQQTTRVAEWKATWDVFPSEGNRVQVSATQGVEGGYYRLSRVEIEGLSKTESLTPTL